MRFRLTVDGEAHDVEVEGRVPGLTVKVDGIAYRARTRRGEDGIEVRLGSRIHRIVIRGSRVAVDGLAHDVIAEDLEPTAPNGLAGAAARAGAVIEVRPPMPGRVVKVRVGVGDHVRRGQTVAVLEAMKMQNEIPAPADAVVRQVDVREGESILGDRVIAVLETR